LGEYEGDRVGRLVTELYFCDVLEQDVCNVVIGKADTETAVPWVEGVHSWCINLVDYSTRRTDDDHQFDLVEVFEQLIFQSQLLCRQFFQWHIYLLAEFCIEKGQEA